MTHFEKPIRTARWTTMALVSVVALGVSVSCDRRSSSRSPADAQATQAAFVKSFVEKWRKSLTSRDFPERYRRELSRRARYGIETTLEDVRPGVNWTGPFTVDGKACTEARCRVTHFRKEHPIGFDTRFVRDGRDLIAALCVTIDVLSNPDFKAMPRPDGPDSCLRSNRLESDTFHIRSNRHQASPAVRWRRLGSDFELRTFTKIRIENVFAPWPDYKSTTLGMASWEKVWELWSAWIVPSPFSDDSRRYRAFSIATPIDSKGVVRPAPCGIDVTSGTVEPATSSTELPCTIVSIEGLP